MNNFVTVGTVTPTDAPPKVAAANFATAPIEPPSEIYQGRRAALSLDIVVVGCGLGGLAAAFCLAMAGHKVTVLESVATIGEIGAGIVVSPNISRLMIRWGLQKRLQEVAVEPGALTVRRWCSGERLLWVPWGDSMMKNYGAPLYHTHRADLHRMLYDLAESHVNIRTNCRVVSMDPSLPSLTLRSGEVVHADLVIGADGLKSTTRHYVVGRPDEPTPTGDAAYRAVLPIEMLLAEPDLRSLVETPGMTIWLGPERHIVTYSIRANMEYNIVMCHADRDPPEELWRTEESADRMAAEFVGWEPRIQKLLSLIPSTFKWKLMDCAPLATWVHKDGKLALLGDSCHPMLPYAAQGAAMAIEDAAVLGNLFSRLSSHAQITPLLHAYEAIRYDRATGTQKFSRLRKAIVHLPDGPEQEQRDRMMRAAMEDALRETRGDALVGNTNANTEGNTKQLEDNAKNAMQFGYDADEEAEKWWREHGESEVGSLGVLSTS
ncbi:FAD/NAD(P)-binding domain-containing protein [Pisolithus marmoratus]|nr:FAD/NAD(P)-binding domain-containing protein [Pisolithus marmoratus]